MAKKKEYKDPPRYRNVSDKYEDAFKDQYRLTIGKILVDVTKKLKEFTK